MTIDEIKQAVEDGKRVYWSHTGYRVIKDSIGQFLIQHIGGNCIGLTNLAGTRLNGNEQDFFIS